MTNQQPDLNPTPLVERLLEKSRAGRLNWEPTADRKAFVVSVGGEATFKVSLIQVEEVSTFGQSETVDVPILLMLDEKGKTLWEVRQRDVKGIKLWDLYTVARRIGNKLDERMVNAIRALENL